MLNLLRQEEGTSAFLRLLPECRRRIIIYTEDFGLSAQDRAQVLMLKLTEHSANIVVVTLGLLLVCVGSVVPREQHVQLVCLVYAQVVMFAMMVIILSLHLSRQVQLSYGGFLAVPIVTMLIISLPLNDAWGQQRAEIGFTVDLGNAWNILLESRELVPLMVVPLISFLLLLLELVFSLSQVMCLPP